MEDEYELTIGRMKMTRESDAATHSGNVDIGGGGPDGEM